MRALFSDPLSAEKLIFRGAHKTAIQLNMPDKKKKTAFVVLLVMTFHILSGIMGVEICHSTERFDEKNFIFHPDSSVPSHCDDDELPIEHILHSVTAARMNISAFSPLNLMPVITLRNNTLFTAFSQHHEYITDDIILHSQLYSSISDSRAPPFSLY
jgi:hypothetical protein